MHLTWLLLFCFVSEFGAVPLLTSWTTSIKLFEETDTTNITAVSATTTLAVAVDYHYKRGEFYFSDGLGRINRGWLRPKGAGESPLVIAEVKLSDGLAVDWVHNNLYWTDVNRRTVEMANLDGLYRRTFFNATHGVQKPRAIVVDPFERLLFWSDWGDDARIESCGLDGKQKRTIVSQDLIWPNGIALDVDNSKMFILDGFSFTISSCNYDGSELKVISKSQENIQQAFGITFYANKLYWTSWRTRTLFAMDIDTKNTESVITRTSWRGILERMMGVKAVHSSLQKASTVIDRCQSAGCSHECLVGRGNTFSCICPYGYSLHADGRNCVEEGYLLVSWRKTIRRYTLIGSNEEALVDSAKAAISLAYHFKKQLVFWSDIEEHRIYRAPLGQLNNKTVIASPETCDGLAVDWVHDILYWTDTERNTLEAAMLDGTKHMVIFSQDLDQPRDIALDPLSGLMFWTDWGADPKIERSTLDGLERETIINTDIAWPNGITIDFDQKKIYWIDGKLETMTSSNYDGSKKKVIFHSQSISAQPFSITLFNDKVYWTDWKSQAIFQADKTVINEVDVLANSSIVLLRPNGLKVVHSALQKQKDNPCADVKCKSLCLGTKSQSAHCMGEQDEETAIDEIKLTYQVFNDSSKILVTSSKTPSLAVITAKCVRREGCAEDKSCSEQAEKVYVFSNQKSFNISGLLPASHYNVDFKSPNHYEKFQILTSPTDPPEIPKLKPVDVQGKSVLLKWDPVDTCVPGFQYYHYKLFKTAVENDVPLEGKTNLTQVTINNLEHEVEYTAQIYTFDSKYFSSVSFSTHADETAPKPCMKEELLCDGNKNCTDGSDEDINICAGIENVEVYKKSKSEIHLRIQVAKSTRKGLKKFTGIYRSNNSNNTQIFDEPAVPCVMWPDSYCFQISSLIRDTTYTFNISATLKDGKVGKTFTVSEITKEEKPGPPENVHATAYNSTSVVIQWLHPHKSNGIVRNFIINVHEVETFDKDSCCLSFPIIESPVQTEEHSYDSAVTGLTPASTYAFSVAAKNLYVGSSSSVDINTPPPPMDIMKNPNVAVSSLLPLSWQPKEDQLEKKPQYYTLIKWYLLLVTPPQLNPQTNILETDLAPLRPLLNSQFEDGFSLLWYKNKDDEEAFQHPVEVKGLDSRKQYRFAWVQVSQYNDAYGIDYMMSDPFIAL